LNWLVSLTLSTSHGITFEWRNIKLGTALTTSLSILDISVREEESKLKMNIMKKPNLTKLERSQSELSNNLKNILIGLLLGDLNAHKQTKNSNTMLRFRQGIVHEEYLLHLFELFGKYSRMDQPSIISQSPDKRTGKVYSSIYFNTYSLTVFNELYDLFYRNFRGKKVIPDNIGDLLTPLGLAYLLCDDGCYDKTNRAVIICTESFFKAEVDLLASVLMENFKLKCTVIKKQDGFRVRISSKSLLVLQSLLKDVMPPIMLYKIGL